MKRLIFQSCGWLCFVSHLDYFVCISVWEVCFQVLTAWEIVAKVNNFNYFGFPAHPTIIFFKKKKIWLFLFAGYCRDDQ